MLRARSLGLLLVGIGVVAVGVGCRTGELDFTGVSTISPTPTGSLAPDGPFGNGQTGPHTVSGNETPNVCHRVTLATNSSVIVDSTTGINVNDKVIFVQMQDNLDSVGGGGGGGGFATYVRNAGLWEIARVQQVGGTILGLYGPLGRRYSSSSFGGGTKTSAAQVCSLPEYTDLTIQAGGALLASPWDGNIGGIVALQVKGTLSLDGTIDASGFGFQGGQTPNGSSTTNTAGDASLSSGHGGRGESLDARSYGPSSGGRLPSTNGGGGGDPYAAGGAGGSNGGSGGNGGLEFFGNVRTGGIGASGLGGIGVPMMWLGGGGGAGAIGPGLPDQSTGGTGGGGVYVAAKTITGSGAFKANGANGNTAVTDKVGGGGGGAGGAVILYTDTSGASAFAGMISVTGGLGGDVTADGAGPGGGGGGGRVHVPTTISPTPLTGGGSNGTSSGSARSSTPGTAGVVEH